jgi:hypothetical protein
MSRQILGTFQSRDVADSVKDALMLKGYAASDMIVMANRQSSKPPEDAKLERDTEGDEGMPGIEEKVGKFVLGALGKRTTMEGNGTEGVGKDGALLAVTVGDDAEAVARVIALLESHHAADIEESQPD